MGLSYKKSSVPTTLREGEFAVVDGVTYVGNSDNEPQAVGGDKGYKYINSVLITIPTDDPTFSKYGDVNNDIELTPTAGTELFISSTDGKEIEIVSANWSLIYGYSAGAVALLESIYIEDVFTSNINFLVGNNLSFELANSVMLTLVYKLL